MARWQVPAGPGFVPAFQQRYYRLLSEELRDLPASAPGILPGVRPLLDALAAARGCTTALLTGNYAATARLKLDRFGLWDYFSFGAFGDDEAERNRLVAVALERARLFGVPPVAPRDVVVVGDTPRDVACGAINGTRTLAVATGSYDVETLREAGADLAVQDLSDTASIMAWLSGGQRAN